MKHSILIMGLIIFFQSDIFANNIQDSTVLDVQQVNRLIKGLKKELEPKKYYLFDNSFDKRDISFSYPEKIVGAKTFDIEIVWNGKVISIYEVDSKTYKFTGRVIDLR